MGPPHRWIIPSSSPSPHCSEGDMVESAATPQKGPLPSKVRTPGMRSGPLTREGPPREHQEDG